MELMDENSALLVYRFPRETELNFSFGEWKEEKDLRIRENVFHLVPFESDKAKIRVKINSNRLSESSPDLNEFIHKGLRENNSSANPHFSYEDLVSKGLEKIRNGDIQKVVLSRRKLIDLRPDFDYIRYLKMLSEKFPECFIYLIMIPGKLCWIGASPELLAKYENQSFQTISLAGTLSDKQLAAGEKWSDKENEEQKLVTDFILEKIRQSDDRVKIKGPYTFKTGKLNHLKTEIQLNARPEESIQILKELHPTPAIAGIPKEKALDFIFSNEGYDREFYAGYIGISASKMKFDFYVNLRCMQLFRNSAYLYAGAGITSESEPEKEFQETERKLQALKEKLDA